MTDFQDELREALSRKAADAPQPGGIPEGVLRRAKRRRATNAALAGALALTLAFGGFIGVRAAIEAAGPERPGVRLGDEPPVPGPNRTADPAPTVTHGPPAPPSPLVEVRCGRTEDGSDEVFPDFVDVEVDQSSVSAPEPFHANVTFHFEPMAGIAEPPFHVIGFTDQLVTDGEGAPVEVQGNAFLAVAFMARGVDLSGEEFTPIYTGPKEIVTNGDFILELEQTGDFEGMVSWGIGLAEKTCYTVDAGPDHLTITFVSGTD